MATHIVERDLKFCSLETKRVLAELGYHLQSHQATDGQVTGTYGKVNKKGLLFRPLVRIDIKRFCKDTTQVDFRPVPQWGAYIALFSVWLFLVLVPMCAIGLGFRWSLPGGSHLSFGQAYIASMVWVLICTYYFWSRLFAVEKEWADVERSLWEQLNTNGQVSHEIKGSFVAEFGVIRLVRVILLCPAIIGGLILLMRCLLPLPGRTEDTAPSSQAISLWLQALKLLLEHDGISIGLALLLLGGILSIPFGWLASSYPLPHRYHWKVKFYGTYACWMLIISMPGLLFVLHVCKLDYETFPWMWPLQQVIQRTTIFVILAFQGLLLTVLLRIAPETRNDEEAELYYAPPSTRYEDASGPSTEKHLQRNLKRQRVWTWANFFLYSIFCYSSIAYLVTTLFECVVAIMGGQWALARFWRWPLLIHFGGTAAAVEGLLFTCLIGTPMCSSIILAIKSYRRSMRTSALADEIGQSVFDAHLPLRPLKCIVNKLGMDRLVVIETPDTSVNLSIRKLGVWKKRYILSVSLGARKRLCEAEMEALLWHECAHVELLSHNIFRDIVGLLTPWGPRFLDLAEDLYEEERNADLFVVQKMGNAQPLNSALKKIDEYERNLTKKKKGDRGDSRSLRDNLGYLKVIWSLGWAGYLHPEARQRLRWLQETKEV